MARWTGKNDSGPSAFTPQEVKRVADVLIGCNDPISAMSVEQVAYLANVNGRTVRAIFSACDGVNFLLGYTDEGVYIATECDDAVNAYTRRLKHQAQHMTDRVKRREAMAARMPLRGQLPLI